MSSIPCDPSKSAPAKAAKTNPLNQWGASHALKPAHLKRMGIRRVTQDAASRLLTFPAPAGGFLIPYFNLDGSPSDFFRIRLDDYSVPWMKATGRKPRRYSQPPKSGIAAYFAPLIDWPKIAADAGERLLFTEGEAKGAAACAHGVPCIAFGGVSSWRGSRAGLPLLPELQPFEWKDREVVIVYDRDPETKDDVLREENTLASVLVNAKARVKIVRLPASSDGSKCGLDDYLLAHDADSLRALIDATPEWALSRELSTVEGRYPRGGASTSPHRLFTAW